MTEDADSVAPHVEALVKSKRVQGWGLTALRWLIPAFLSSVAIPAFTWVDTRYPRTEAEAVIVRVGLLERVAGLPEPGAEGAEKTLRDRVLALEKALAGSEQRALKMEHDLYLALVGSVAGKHARDAQSTFEYSSRCEGEVGVPANPYRCQIRPALAAANLLAAKW